MATYSFETITAAQALAIDPSDTLMVTSAPALSATVLYGPSAITLVLGAHSLDFGVSLAAISQAGHLNFADGSILYIGDGANNTLDYTQNPHDHAEFGGGGDDTLNGSGPHAVLQGNAGDDHLLGFAQSNTVYGGQGNDDIAVSGTSDHNFLQGNKGDDHLGGSFQADTILGGQGNDTIGGVGGLGDYLDGNLGNDVINLLGDHGIALGEDGDDQIFVNGVGFDTVDGGGGNDTIFTGTTAGDSIAGGDGADNIVADCGASTISGGAGNDTISVRGTGNSVDAGDGDDHLIATVGGSTIDAGAGNDTIEVLNSHLVLFGGSGRDTFVIETAASRADSAPTERIQILDWASEDRVRFADIFPAVTSYGEATAPDEIAAASNFPLAPGAVMAVQVGTEVLVLFQASNATGPALNSLEAITLVGRTLADIDASNFI